MLGTCNTRLGGAHPPPGSFPAVKLASEPTGVSSTEWEHMLSPLPPPEESTDLHCDAVPRRGGERAKGASPVPAATPQREEGCLREAEPVGTGARLPGSLGAGEEDSGGHSGPQIGAVAGSGWCEQGASQPSG